MKLLQNKIRHSCGTQFLYLFFFIALLCLSLFLVACRGDTTEGADTSASTNAQTPSAETDVTHVLDQTINTDGSSPAVSSSPEISGTPSTSPSDTRESSGHLTVGVPTRPEEPATAVTTETNAPGVSDGPAIITLPPLETKDPSSGTEPPAEETLPYDPALHPGDSSAYKGLMIASVYGTGKKNTDAAAQYSFVQLYNASSKDMSLAGVSLYYKSDGASPYDQFAFPADAVIPAGGYYLVRGQAVSGYDTAMAVLDISLYDAEWDVTLDNHEIRLLLAPSQWVVGKDEDITLFDDAISVFVATETYSNNVYTIDGMSKNKVAVRTALTDYSGYHTVNLTSRATDDLKKVAPRTSKGEVNSVVASRLTEVTFSQPAGVYEKAFNLTLEAPEGYTIYYTMDGSDPTNGGTRTRYSKPLALKDSSEMPWGETTYAWIDYGGIGALPMSEVQPGGYVVKAYATNGTESTPVYTNTYFVIPELCEYGVPVISLSVPVEEMIGPEGFYNNFLLEPGNITGGRVRGFAMMEVFHTDGTRVGHSNVELAVSGNGSSGWRMKSLRVYYKGSNNVGGGLESDLDYDLFEGRAVDTWGQAITSFDRLLLRNSGNDCATSYIRDAYMQRTAAGLNADTMASTSVLVFINGEFWGVYNIRERYSPEYIESHYGVDKDNVAIIESDYSQVHTDQNAPYVVSSGLEDDADSFNALTEYMRNHDLSDPAMYAYVCEQMDIDSFIDMWVVRLFYNARDWPENNMKVWRNRNPDDPSGFDTKWHFALLDLDMGLSFYTDANDTTENADFFRLIDSDNVCARMMRNLLANAEFKEQFIQRYYEVVKEYFTPEYLSELFEELREERDALMPLQEMRWGSEGASVDTWNGAVDLIRSFIQNRQGKNLEMLYGFFGISEEEIVNSSCKRVEVIFNSSRASVTVDGIAVQNGQILTFEEDSRTLTVKAEVTEGNVLTAIVWTARDGATQRVEAAEATFNVSSTGILSVYTKSENAHQEAKGAQLVAGASYMFYLTADGDLYAWGDNRYGVLGLTGSSVVATPTYVMSSVAKVATGRGAAFENGEHTWMTAILTTDGRLFTVGANSSGQLGRNGTSDDSSPGQVNFSGNIVDVAVGHDHMLVLDENGVLWGIGSNSNGQLGASHAGSSVQSFQKIAQNVTAITAGRRSSAYIDDNGNLYGLGDNRWSKLVYGGDEIITTPVLMMENVVYIASGEHQMVAITENGDLYYAGWREFGTFTQGGGNNPTMRKVMGGVVQADAFNGNLIILGEDGNAYGYGLNVEGGLGSVITGGTPKILYEGVLSIASGYGFSTFLCNDGIIRVLGSNAYGQAGNGRSGGHVNFTEVDM